MESEWSPCPRFSLRKSGPQCDPSMPRFRTLLCPPPSPLRAEDERGPDKVTPGTGGVRRPFLTNRPRGSYVWSDGCLVPPVHSGERLTKEVPGDVNESLRMFPGVRVGVVCPQVTRTWRVGRESWFRTGLRP